MVSFTEDSQRGSFEAMPPQEFTHTFGRMLQDFIQSKNKVSLKNDFRRDTLLFQLREPLDAFILMVHGGLCLRMPSEEIIITSLLMHTTTRKIILSLLKS